MGKTRLEELFYELYSSSNQHDSWQRYAMIRELRNLMKQPKASGSDSFERELDDEDLVETEVATELIGIEVATDPIETEHELVSQVVDSVSDVLLVHKADSDDKEVEELPQKSTSDKSENVAHQLFDQKPVRVTHKEKRMKHLKAWKFKFKRRSLVGIMLPIEQYKLSNHDLEMRILPFLQRFSVVRMGIHVVFCLQELKPMWWVGYNEAAGVTSTKQELSHWSVANHVLRDAQESFGSKGLAYDGCVILGMNFAGFERGEAELLATSQKMQRIDLFSFRCFCTNQIFVAIHTEIEENLEFNQLLAAVERFEGCSNVPTLATDVDVEEKQAWIENAWFKNQVFSDFEIASWIGLEIYSWKYKKQINIGHISLNGMCNKLVYDEEKKKLRQVGEDVKKGKNSFLRDVKSMSVQKRVLLQADETIIKTDLCQPHQLQDTTVSNWAPDSVKQLQQSGNPIFQNVHETLWLTLSIPPTNQMKNVHTRTHMVQWEWQGVKHNTQQTDFLVWHRWKNKAGKLKASLVCSGKRWSLVVYAFYDHTVVLRKEPILSPKIKRGFELSYLPNLEVKVSLNGEDLI